MQTSGKSSRENADVRLPPHTHLSSKGFLDYFARKFYSSFRDGLKDQTRNLKIPGSMLRIAPE